MRFPFSLCLPLFLQTLTLITSHPPFNISHFIYPKIGDELRPRPSPLLQDVLRAISLKQGWVYSSKVIRVSKLDPRNAKFGTSAVYDSRLRMGKIELIFSVMDEVSVWKKMKRKKKHHFESLLKEVSSAAVLQMFRVQGPVELLVGGEDELSLQLPLNSTYAGLKRILVGKGITAEVRNALGVSLLHSLDYGLQVNKSDGINRECSKFWPFQHLLCKSLLPVHVSGSPTVTAYLPRNLHSPIETTLQSKDTIELLAEKCYTAEQKWHYRPPPIDSLRTKIVVMEKLLKRFLGSTMHEKGEFGFLRVSIRPSNTVVRFRMDLERDIRRIDTTLMAEWRTRPTVERVCFEVVARFDGVRLKPLRVNKVAPFIKANSYSWSNLMSNISFTKFPSVLVPPEALTLDVMW